jgi:hypothetical protein
MNNWFKKNGVHFVITAIFLAACFFFFTPAFQGKTLGQGDVMRAQSTQKEINDYKKRDTTILWTNQILGGMPAYQIWAPWPNNIANRIINVLDHVFPSPIYIVLLLLFGGYFLFSVLKLNPWLAAAGALAFTFSSYNIIYIAAGHVNQELAIALFAPIVASIILVMNGRFILGSSLLALFLALEIKANHIQMTYYLLIALLILFIIEFYNAIRNKTLPFFGKALAYIACATLLAVAVNASTLWSTAEYAGDSIRGKSNLTKGVTEAKSGVARDYAYEFSEGVGETLTFLIPNAYGGATNGQASDDSRVAKLLVEKGADASQAQNIAQSLPLYWGDKRFTEGPWYFGAVVVFLFIFGLFVIKNRIKWWLLATVILTMLLSFGGNFPLISDLFFNYFPLYNKFRAVESILSVASLCFPIMAFLAIKEAIENPDKKTLFSKAKIALYITGGLTLIVAVVPDLFLSFKSHNHQQLIDGLTQMARGDSGLGNGLASALVQDRISAARADAVRTLIFLAIGFAILWAYFKGKINVLALSILFLAVILVDLWTVDKRYLKDEYYTERQENPTPQPREVDTFIAKDTDPDFKVLDLSQNIMEDTATPFFNKSIGGYSAARMKRYNELIESQFSKSVNHSVLDMLNTKYIIVADPKTNNLSMTRNETACGHAWFVKSVKYVKDADQEMQTISAFSPKDEAIVDQRYKNIVGDKQMGYDPNGTIKLVKYSPDDMVYQSGTTIPSVAVFSEIYYDKGWKMYIDGKESPYFRADYVLRAAVIPVGNHKIEFIFHPASYYTGEKISLAGSILLILALGGAIYTGIKRKPEDEKKGA